MINLDWVSVLALVLAWGAVLTAITFFVLRLLRQRPLARQRSYTPSITFAQLRQQYERGEIDTPTFARLTEELARERRDAR